VTAAAPTATIATQVCIAGGGPAGMMLGFLLARAGVDVVVLEKHADFFRDFRGDTIHPSTLEVMHELGLLDAFLALPHQEVREMAGEVYGHPVTFADFSHLPTHCKFLVFMPQWDFLDFIADHARRYPGFHLRMAAEVTDLVERDGVVAGVRATTPDGPLEVTAALTVGADGRHTTVRERAGLASVDLGAPIDVLWFHLPRAATHTVMTGGYIARGRFLVLINRDAYWQCGYVIAKGGMQALQAAGLEHFRATLGGLVPWLAESLPALASWDDVKLLTVQINRMPVWWRTGLLCIGDAAHAMSPVGGVGINLAIQDAVAASNILARPLRDGTLAAEHLAAVQRRREWPAQVTQRAQIAIQDNVVLRVLAGAGADSELPLPVRALQRFALLRRIPARLVGLGVRPEHVETAAHR
jgi:2-polyprenyl-6-methoxyphenol hydroxylase-like FAD-dependent oxidoreductase